MVVTIAAMLGGGAECARCGSSLVYLIQTFGELCLSPVGLSTVTKLSPARMVGLMLGVWFLSISIGSYIAGLTTRLFAGKRQCGADPRFGDLRWHHARRRLCYWRSYAFD